MTNTVSRTAKIRAFLAAEQLQHQWLIEQLARCGIQCDKFELSRTLNGHLTTPKAVRILEESGRIMDRYRAFCQSKQAD